MPGIENNLISFNDKNTLTTQPSPLEIDRISHEGAITPSNHVRQNETGDNGPPLLTITTNSARAERRAGSFYQDLVEGKCLLGVQLVRQQTKEFFDECPLSPPVSSTAAGDSLVKQQQQPATSPHNNAEGGNHSSSLTNDEATLVASIENTGTNVEMSKVNEGINNSAEDVLTQSSKSNMDNSASNAHNNSSRMYGPDESDSDVDNSERSDVTKENNNKVITNKNNDVTKPVSTTPDESGTTTTDGKAERLSDNANVLNDNNSDLEIDNKDSTNNMDHHYPRDVDFNKLPSSSFLQTLEQQSASDSEGEEERELGTLSPDFSQPSSLGGGGDCPLPQGPDDAYIQQGVEEPSLPNDVEADGLTVASPPPTEAEEDLNSGERLEREVNEGQNGLPEQVERRYMSDSKLDAHIDHEKDDVISQKSCDTLTKEAHNERSHEPEPSEGGDTYNYEDDFTDSEADLSLVNKSQTTADYLGASYSDGGSLHHSRMAGSDKKSYTSVASSKTLHGRPQKRYGSEKQPAPPAQKKDRGQAKVRVGDMRTSRNVSRQSSSSISQPITFRQKAGVKLARGGGVDHHHEFAPSRNNTKKKPSVPTQLKAEALWCDGLLQVTLRGPPSKLPPIDDVLLSHHANTPTFPVDLELTFIPEFKPGYRYNKPFRFPPKTTGPSNFQYYKKRKPIGSSFPTMPETDRNVIDNRAVGIGFNTQMTPPKDRMPVTKLPYISHKQQQQFGHRTGGTHHVTSASSKPAKHSYRRS